MSYILKTTAKPDNTARISLTIHSCYREFDSIAPLVEYLFENAIYIESYTIFEVKPLKVDDSIVLCPSGGIFMSTE